MGYGIKILNDNGAVQIDQDYMNLCYKMKFTVTGIDRTSFNLSYMGGDLGGSSDPEGPGTFYVVDYPAANNAVVAVQPPAGVRLAPVNLLNESSTGSPPPAGYKRLVFTAPGSTAYTINVFVYDSQPQALAPGKYGMIIRNAAGTVVFNSENRPVRVVRPINVGGIYENNAYGVNGSRSYAFMYANTTGGVYYPASGGTRNGRSSCLYQPNSTTVQVSYAPYFVYSPIGPGGGDDWNPTYAMLIDVTGL
jgi:hypothetical protein